jgi:hypothetical protein
MDDFGIEDELKTLDCDLLSFAARVVYLQIDSDIRYLIDSKVSSRNK